MTNPNPLTKFRHRDYIASSDEILCKVHVTSRILCPSFPMLGRNSFPHIPFQHFGLSFNSHKTDALRELTTIQRKVLRPPLTTHPPISSSSPTPTLWACQSRMGYAPDECRKCLASLSFQTVLQSPFTPRAGKSPALRPGRGNCRHPLQCLRGSTMHVLSMDTCQHWRLQHDR